MEAQKETHHWCDKQVKLLRSWAERAAGKYAELHQHLAEVRPLTFEPQAMETVR